VAARTTLCLHTSRRWQKPISNTCAPQRTRIPNLTTANTATTTRSVANSVQQIRQFIERKQMDM
jgi:hypothetical protein